MGLTWNLKEAELLLNQGLLALQTNVVLFFFHKSNDVAGLPT